jgi:predicted dehydrogenase
MPDPIRFALVGSGWRAGFFQRVAAALPDLFDLTGLLTRDPETGDAVARDWGTASHRTLDGLLAAKPKFVVVSVPWPITPVLLRELTDRGVPALAETPPAPDLDGLKALEPLAKAGARIQVAEQYQFQPMHAARIAVARSGRLGTVTQAQVSSCHGYHGIDLIRRLLRDDEPAPVTITARSFASPLVKGPDRSGPPTTETIIQSEQVIAQFDFGDRLGVLDFTDDQYFAWIRSPRHLVRGERGEINGTTVRYLADFQTPITLEFTRHDAGRDGDLSGYHHVGITLGAEWLSRNEFAPGRLADDEIAIATCLQRMAEYIDGGPDFCSLADGVHDHYLTLKMAEAVASGQPVEVPGPLW